MKAAPKIWIVVLFCLGCGEGGERLAPTTGHKDAAAIGGDTHDAACLPCLPYDAGALASAIDEDAGESLPEDGSCVLAKAAPSCDAVPCTWQDAGKMLPTCATPPLTPYYAARCGSFDALVAQGTDSLTYYIYNSEGQLVVERGVGFGHYCKLFDASVSAPEDCDAVTPKC
jgi:hypothetical protein